ncbi:MAG TPA: hypothetical protein VF167_07905 [Longimicrobiaceae bacterium]
MTIRLNREGRSGAALLAILVLASGLTACDPDSNAWSDLPTGGRDTVNDDRAPNVSIVAPDSTGRVAVGDSILIRVEVSDNAGIDSVRLSGFSLRGSSELGTLRQVERFESKIVDLSTLSEAVTDTTIARYLVATSDSLPEDGVYLTATVRDIGGNVRADTVRISIGGPRLQVLSPGLGSTVRAGAVLTVQLFAADSVQRIQTVGVRLAGEGIDLREELELDPPLARVDTVLQIEVPVDAPEEVELQAYAQTATNDSTLTTPLQISVSPAGGDDTPPQVRFTVSAASRKEMDDTITVRVSAVDSSRVERVGVSVLPSLRLPSSTDTLSVQTFELAGDSAEFRIALSDLGAVEPEDTSYVMRLEVTAFAVDTAGNCATATIPATQLAQACSPESPESGEDVAAPGPGARVDIVIVRGATTGLSGSGNHLVDLVADRAGRKLYVSNLSRNRVEVLPFGATSFATPVSVGSEPWGLALGRSGDTMFVANSGGTNISVIPLGGGSLKETARIHTSNLRLYAFEYDIETDSVSTLTEHDYSDRPQFLAQSANGQLLYSTKPTPAAADGTIRIFDASRDTTQGYNRGSEIMIWYARDGKSAGKGVVVNALEVDLDDHQLIVWPRRLKKGTTDPTPIMGFPTDVAAQLAVMAANGETDTRVEFYVDIADVGLTDTTFVATSADHEFVAFGEGARNPGRVFLVSWLGDEFGGSTTDTDDLVGNAAERVVGLALNGDGTLGVARGQQSYFFNQSLRLQGTVSTGTPSGGVALHPANVSYPSLRDDQRAFVSGVDEEGNAYVDVVDTYSFRRIRRIPIREPITGAMTVVEVGSGDPDYGQYALRLFGITDGGVVEIGLSEDDLK